MDEVRAAKQQARALVRARRRELVEHQGEASRAAQGAALASAFLGWLREYAARLGRPDLAGLTVTAFEPMPTEPPVDELVRQALHAGIEVLLPVTIRENRTLRWVRAGEPPEEREGPQALPEVDVALIPGLAVDRAGYRLGQGGGYYDRTLPMLRAEVPVIVALHDHELPGTDGAPVVSVPRVSHDIPVDAVLTTTGVTQVGTQRDGAARTLSSGPADGGPGA
jgi:5-formyltetrahydrofolate cyclo-ligase